MSQQHRHGDEQPAGGGDPNTGQLHLDLLGAETI
jgi:hypothetical protein